MFHKIISKPLIVRKNSGIGWTLNLNHPATWIVIGGLLAIKLYLVISG
ncbi:DUF5808 domain-containing protein [Paenibacillus sp. MMS20-IR301]|nr:DUF5808 domain-containing protein [Paenibacillus sp. MMS20-IR301]WNS45440.1 DUF5808 domain-containing protein [Paenibacillus sp. MMS20-IR301]